MDDQDKKKLLDALKPAVRTTTNQSRENLFDRYMNEPYGDEVAGKSAYRSTDVADVVEAVYAEGMEVLTADDHLVEFKAVSQEDEKAARQETEIIHHQFREQNNSFTVLATWFKEGLIEQNAYVRSGWVEKHKVQIEEYEGLTPDEFMAVYTDIAARDGDYEIETLEGASVEGEVFTPEMGDDGEPTPIDVRIRCTKTVKEYEIEPIPQSEMMVSPRWNKVTLDGCPAYAHKGKKTKGELQSMGFSKDSIAKVQGITEDSAEHNRHSTTHNDNDNQDTDDRRFEICEGYVTISLDDSTDDTLHQVWTTGDGGEVLQWEGGEDAIEEVEYGPFSAWTPYIVPHRHVGRSTAELATSAQKLKTVIWRQMLDNMYKTNYPRPHVVENLASRDTMDDLANAEEGSPIRMAAHGAVTWDKPPTILADAFPILERADQDLEKHAGASRYAQGLDANTLSKSQIGSEGVQTIMDAGQRRMQVIVRTFAETGIRELFLKMHADFRRGPTRRLAMKIKGEWVESNPMGWRERTDMTVRVGTGRADAQKMLTGLSWMLEKQIMAMQTEAPNVGPEHIYETMRKMTRSMGLGSIEPYMADPATIPPQPEEPEQPDPMAESALLMAQAENTKAQAAMVTAQTNAKKAETDTAFKAEQARLDREIAEFNAQEAQANLQIKVMELQIKQVGADSKSAEVDIKEALAVAKIDGDDEDRNGNFGGIQ